MRIKVRFHYLIITLALSSLLAVNSKLSSACAQGTAFTYQGRLNSGTNPATGNFDLTFALYNAGTGGSQTGSTITTLDVGVTNGLFIVTNDFGAVYNGAAYWLQIGVRTNGGSTFTALSPRQALTPTPYAVTAENVTGAISLGQLPSSLVTNHQAGVTLSNVTVAGNLNLSTTPTINSGSSTLLYADGIGDFFAGQNAGNVTTSGIGQNTATGNDALFLNTSGFYNTATGNSALYQNSVGTGNVATGASALYANTNGSDNTAAGTGALGNNTSGSDNVANGYQALLYNTTGYQNTANGYYGLFYNVSGFNNTASGYGALEQLGENTSVGGSYNLALGYEAGFNLSGNETSNIDIGNPGVAGENNVIRLGSGQTTAYIAGVITGNGAGLTNFSLNAAQLISQGNSAGGTGNFFVGPTSGNSTTTGSYNTATGLGALGLNASGADNVAFGTDALAFNNSGSSNTAIGVNALGFTGFGSNNTAVGANTLVHSSGGANTAVGVDALFANQSGYNNTAEGYQAIFNETYSVDNVATGVATLQSLTSGAANTAVGTYAFQNLTAGSGNVGLGYSAGNSLVTGTNNIYIGNPGGANENETIRIGNGQTETYIDGTILLDGSDTNNGLAYIPGNDLPGISVGEGPFLYGFEGGWLGAVGPTTVCLSWDYSGDVWVSNNFSTATLTIRGGSDLAEPFKITSDNDEVSQGSVVVIDEENPGRLKVSSQPYDTRVAGVLSGANGVNPGIQMQQQGLLEGGKNVALTGRVYVQADASYGSIKPGDLLTTSATAGHAMKVLDHGKAQGAILGKAMSGLKEGKGMVLVLVTLQ